jgi:hypothetical protein
MMEDVRNELQNDLKKVGTVQDWISFNKMITPIIIKVLFWIGVVVSVIFGLFLIFLSFTGGGFQSFLMGLVIMIFGPIFVRVYCEILFVIFGIFDELKAINAKTK